MTTDLLSAFSLALGVQGYLLSMKEYFKPPLYRLQRKVKDRYHVYNFNTEENICLWRDLLKTKFYNGTNYDISKYETKKVELGDIVELRGANISRWLPLFPGKMVSKEANEKWSQHNSLFPENHDFGLEEELAMRNDTTVLTGEANINLLPFNDQFLLNACSDMCPLGIPLLVSSTQYEEMLQDVISSEMGASARIIATVAELPGGWNDRIEAKYPKEAIFGLPRYVLRLEKLEDVGSPSNMVAFAWTQYGTVNQKYSARLMSMFKPCVEGDIDDAIQMLVNYKLFLESPLIGGDWQNMIEFDEQQMRLASAERRSPYSELDHIQLFALYYTSPWGRYVSRNVKTAPSKAHI